MGKHKRRASKRRAPAYDPTPSIYGAARTLTDVAVGVAVIRGVAGIAARA